MSESARNLPAVVDEEPESPYLFQNIASPKRRKFLIAYCKTGMIAGAAQLSGVEWRNHYNWLNDEEYAKAFAKAKQIATDSSEDEVVRRARHGIDEPIFYKGERVDSVRKYSDILLMFHLNGERPEKYHRTPDASGQTAPVTINIVEYVDKRTIINNQAASGEQIGEQVAQGVKVKEW